MRFWDFFASSVVVPQVPTNLDRTQYVLTDTGVSNGGNDFPGVSEPFGMVKLGPDLYDGVDSYSGYRPDGNFTGFSMMHVSGIGGAPKYGVVSQMPVLGNINNPLLDLNDTRAMEDVTSVGYYRATLGSGIIVELSATARAGIYNYTFPAGFEEGLNVVVDVSHVLPSYRGKGLGQNYIGGNITVLQDGHYEGSGTFDNGWNRAPPWTIFFCGYFENPASHVRTFIGAGATNVTEAILDRYDTATAASSTRRVGAVFSFAESNIVSRVGVSFISSAQACSNVQNQIAPKTQLMNVTAKTKKIWNEDVLSKITTTETNVTKLQLLYTSMYFMHLLPSNRTGENPHWTSKEPYYDDLIALWDLFRCTTSLLHILQPTTYEHQIRSLIDIYRHEGYMPDSRSSNFNGATQGGSNANNVLADAYMKGVRGAINWKDGYAAMVKDAEVVPENNDDLRDPAGSTKEGRGALRDWLDYGYITPTYTRSVSRAVEYSANDFALHQVATGLKKPLDAAKYLNRSRNWRNHWNPNSTALGFTGFLSPRNITGFLEQDPLDCDRCYWLDAYYQALPFEYSLNAHHDMNTLIALCGGPANFTARVEALFEGGLNPQGSEAFNYTIYNPGNEPSFTTPYLYNFVRRQDLSVKRSRYIADSFFAPTPDGLPGNSDGGAMQSWLLWNMIGLYPLTGQKTFLIGSPWFGNTTISLGFDKTLKIFTSSGSPGSIYVQSLLVNGKPWKKSWVSWADIFAKGGTMLFVLGPAPMTWATGPLPPSPASEFAPTTDSGDIIAVDAVPMAPETTGGRKKKKKPKQKKKTTKWKLGDFLRVVVAWLGISSLIWAIWYYLRSLVRARNQRLVESEPSLEEQMKEKVV